MVFVERRKWVNRRLRFGQRHGLGALCGEYRQYAGVRQRRRAHLLEATAAQPDEGSAMVTRDERLAAAETLTRPINGYQISRAVNVVTDLSVGEHRGDDGVGRREDRYSC